jgi:threonine dehydrogenase-like Zn-dependent dehydrogenase
VRALQIEAPKRHRIVDVPVPDVCDDDVLVEVKLCATCTQWDITTWTGVDIFEREGYPRYPLPPGATGHELSGIVAKTGPAVTSLKVGDRVALWDTTPRPGTEVEPGGFAEYFAGQERRFVAYPDHVPFERAALTELLTCLTAALFKAGEVAGKRVGVSGLGPAGLMAVQALKARGAREVVAFDIQPDRIERAIALGADSGMVPESAEWESLLPRHRNLDIAIDCIGVARSVNNLMRVTRDHLIIFGVPHGDIRFTMDAWFKDLKVEPCGPRSRDGALYARHLLTSGQVNVDGLIECVLPLERYDEGVRLLMEKKAIKVGFDPALPG